MQPPPARAQAPMMQPRTRAHEGADRLWGGLGDELLDEVLSHLPAHVQRHVDRWARGVLIGRSATKLTLNLDHRRSVERYALPHLDPPPARLTELTVTSPFRRFALDGDGSDGSEDEDEGEGDADMSEEADEGGNDDEEGHAAGQGNDDQGFLDAPPLPPYLPRVYEGVATASSQITRLSLVYVAAPEVAAHLLTSNGVNGVWPAVTQLEVGGVAVSVSCAAFPALTHLTVGRRVTAVRDLSSAERLTHLVVRHADVRDLDVSRCAALTDLRLVYARVAGALDLTPATALRRVHIVSDDLRGLDVSRCEALESLTLDCWRLTELGVSRCRALRVLTCEGRVRLTTLDVTACPALATLAVTSPALRDVDVRRCAALTTLRLARAAGPLTLDASRCAHLTELVCPDTPLAGRALDLRACPALTKVHCQGTGLTALDVSACVALQVLVCSRTDIAALDVSACAALRHLECSRTHVAALDLTACERLQTLICRDCADLGGELDVRRCADLRRVDCRGTRVARLDLRGCPLVYNARCTSVTAVEYAACEVEMRFAREGDGADQGYVYMMAHAAQDAGDVNHGDDVEEEDDGDDDDML